MAVYSEGPAEYAEVSSCRSGQQSPSPYATATLIGNSKIITSDPHRFNMFYTTDIYPSNAAGGAQQSQNIINNNNNNYNRSIHSESYCNPHGNINKVNIVENRMANTMMPNMFNQQTLNGVKSGSNKLNRLKLMKPQNFRINFGGSQGDQLYVKVGDINAPDQGQNPPQMQSGSYTWNPQNFNIYENHLHRQEQLQQQQQQQCEQATMPETDSKMLNCD